MKYAIRRAFVLFAAAPSETIAAASDSTIEIAPIACERGPWTEPTWRAAIETELAASRFTIAAENAVGAALASRTPNSLSVNPHDCEDVAMGATLRFALGDSPPRYRRVPLRDVASAARPRALALATVELVRGENETVTLAPAPPRPHAGKNATKPASSLRPAPERPAWRRELARWSFEASAGVTAMPKRPSLALPRVAQGDDFVMRWQLAIIREIAPGVGVGALLARLPSPPAYGRAGLSERVDYSSLAAAALVRVEPLRFGDHSHNWIDFGVEAEVGAAWGNATVEQNTYRSTSDDTFEIDRSSYREASTHLLIGGAATFAFGSGRFGAFLQGGYCYSEVNDRFLEETQRWAGPHALFGLRIRPFE